MCHHHLDNKKATKKQRKKTGTVIRIEQRINIPVAVRSTSKASGRDQEHSACSTICRRD
jgi:hypothetical protein